MRPGLYHYLIISHLIISASLPSFADFLFFVLAVSLPLRYHRLNRAFGVYLFFILLYLSSAINLYNFSIYFSHFHFYSFILFCGQLSFWLCAGSVGRRTRLICFFGFIFSFFVFLANCLIGYVPVSGGLRRRWFRLTHNLHAVEDGSPAVSL